MEEPNEIHTVIPTAVAKKVLPSKNWTSPVHTATTAANVDIAPKDLVDVEAAALPVRPHGLACAPGMQCEGAISLPLGSGGE